MASHPLLLGHRGARGEKSVPENSLAAFDLALTQGCDGFEFDVRLSADNQPVICHDAESRGREIAVTNLRQLSLPTLQDVLARYQETAFLDIELKVAGLEKIAAGLLKTLPPRRGFVVSSFLPGVLKSVHLEDAALPLGLICETRTELERWADLPIEYVIPQYQLLDKELFGQLKEAGKKVLVWTVNLAPEMKRFSAWGVDGIISDHPKMLRALRD